MLKNAGYKCPLVDLKEITTELDFLTPLRFLTLVTEDKDMQEKCDRMKADYENVRKRNSDVYGPKSDEKIVKLLQEKLKISNDIKLIERLIAIIEKYGIPVYGGSVIIYDQVTGISHSCCPNTYHTASTSGLLLKAAAYIPAGEEISFSRVDMTR